MSDPSGIANRVGANHSGAMRPRVVEVDPAPDLSPPRIEPSPRVIVSERTERVTPTVPPPSAPIAVREAPRRRSGIIPLGLAGLAIFFAGWFTVDAIGWISAAFERGAAVGAAAVAAVAAGVAGAGAI